MDEDLSFQHYPIMQTISNDITRLTQLKEDLSHLQLQITAQHSLTHVGSNYFINTVRDKSQPILIQVGSGIYLEMNDDEIQTYTAQRSQEVEFELQQAKNDLAEIQILVGILEQE